MTENAAQAALTPSERISLDAKTTRGIDFHVGEEVNEAALTDLIRAAVALNGARRQPGR